MDPEMKAKLKIAAEVRLAEAYATYEGLQEEHTKARAKFLAEREEYAKVEVAINRAGRRIRDARDELESLDPAVHGPTCWQVHRGCATDAVQRLLMIGQRLYYEIKSNGFTADSSPAMELWETRQWSDGEPTGLWAEPDVQNDET